MREVELKDGRKLLIRKLTTDDAAACIEYGKITGAETEFLLIDETGFGDDVEKEVEWIERMNSNPDSLQLAGFIDGELAGISGLQAGGAKRLAHNAEVGITVKREFWHLGVGTAMINALIEFARENTNIKIINLHVFADNERAINLYKKLGFVETGRRKNRFCVNGRYVDEIAMDLHLEDI